MMTTTTTNLSEVLKLAALGFPVFPIHSIRNGKCTCEKTDCGSPGKHPRTPNGFKDATTDENKIRAWWETWPSANIGLATGKVSGVVVLDVDAKNGGIENLDLLQEKYGPLPGTLISQTGGGGLHYYFRYPEGGLKCSAGKLAVGIDIRGDGGYVVAPPSNHISGHEYVWQDDEPGEIEIAAMPQWIIDGLKKPAEPTAQNLNPEFENDGSITEGKRNSTLFSIAGTLRGRGLGQEAIEAALLAHNKDKIRPPLLEGEVKKLAANVMVYPPGAQPVTGENQDTSRWPDLLPKEAYYGLAGEIVKTIEPHTEADPVALLIQLLTAFGNVVGRGAYFIAEADKHYPNLFTIMVGATAKGRKGSSWGQIENMFKSIDEEWSKSCNHSGLSSGEGLIWVIRDEITKTVPIREKRRIVGYEEVIIDPGIDDKRALVLESEFASPLKVMGREGNTLSPVIRNAWDGRYLRTMTKNSPARATNPHISIIGHITNTELLRHVHATEMCNGFINRFLLVCVKRSKCLPDGGKIHEVDFKALIIRLREAVNFAKGAGELKRDEKARALWHEVYPELSEGKPGLLGAATARAEAQVMRLAMFFALLDLSDVIRVEHLTAALAIWEYCEASARYVFGESLGDPVADEIQRALSNRPEGMTRTEISNHFGRHQKSNQIGRALDALLGNGTAHFINEKGDGRSTERWFSMKHSANKAKNAN